MEREEFLEVLKNIYGSLTFEDWVHAREYVKLQIDIIEKEIKKQKK